LLSAALLMQLWVRIRMIDGGCVCGHSARCLEERSIVEFEGRTGKDSFETRGKGEARGLRNEGSRLQENSVSAKSVTSTSPFARCSW